MKTLALIAGAALLCPLLLEGPPPKARPRIAPVVPSCSPDAITTVLDLEGEADRCVSRATPTCKRGQLAADQDNEMDRCIPERKKPACRPGLELKVRAGEDVCERLELPRCPSGLKLTPMAGQDRCIANAGPRAR